MGSTTKYVKHTSDLKTMVQRLLCDPCRCWRKLIVYWPAFLPDQTKKAYMQSDEHIVNPYVNYSYCSYCNYCNSELCSYNCRSFKYYRRGSKWQFSKKICCPKPTCGRQSQSGQGGRLPWNAGSASQKKTVILSEGGNRNGNWSGVYATQDAHHSTLGVSQAADSPIKMVLLAVVKGARDGPWSPRKGRVALCKNVPLLLWGLFVEHC